MAFRDFNKNLSIEIENLFANISGSESPDNAKRLDECADDVLLGPEVDIQQILERIRNLDIESKS